MDKLNPACYECPKGKNNFHTWSLTTYDDEKGSIMFDKRSRCLACGLVLNEAHTKEVFYD